MTRDGEGFEYDDDHIFDYMGEGDDEFEEECGLGPDGLCSMAGTEHCDWDCGRLNEERIAVMKAVIAIRDRAAARERRAEARAKSTPNRAKVKAARKQRQKHG